MLTTGNPKLDEVLKFPENEIITIYGKPATGKTTIALLIAIQFAKQNKKVLFIDTEHSFPTERLKQIAPDYQDFINNIIVIKTNSLEQQEQIILSLPKKPADLIIIDTISKHYRLVLKENPYKANKSLDQQVSKLKIYTKNNIPVIINSQVYSNMKGETKLVGGNMMKSWADQLIKLEYKTQRRLTKQKPEIEIATFKIVNDGIEIY